MAGTAGRAAPVLAGLGVALTLVTPVVAAVWGDDGSSWWRIGLPALLALPVGAAAMILAWRDALRARAAGERPGPTTLASGLVGVLVLLGGVGVLLGVRVYLAFLHEIVKAGG